MPEHYCLQYRPDDAATSYTLWQDKERVGEIRRHQMHASALYVGTRGLWLRHDEGADIAERGGSWLRRFVSEVRFSRSWSLRDRDQVLARVQRRWHLSPARDVLLFWPQPETPPITASSPHALGRELALHREGLTIGRIRLSGLLAQRVELECDALDPAVAALFMYAMHLARGSRASESAD